jgi:AraC-like DNA-binding protein
MALTAACRLNHCPYALIGTGFILDAAEAVRQFGSNYESACGRTRDNYFDCYIKAPGASPDFLADKLTSILMQHKIYIENYGMDSFICLTFKCNGDESYQEIEDLCLPAYINQLEIMRQRKQNYHYKKMLEIRNFIYLHPQETFSTEEICTRYSFSPGYLRVTYKKCFGVSFYQDCINSRIAMAKYLLCTTNLHISTVAEQCGYTDSKYFMRQFINCTGITPNQYRSGMKKE